MIKFIMVPIKENAQITKKDVTHLTTFYNMKNSFVIYTLVMLVSGSVHNLYTKEVDQLSKTTIYEVLTDVKV